MIGTSIRSTCIPARAMIPGSSPSIKGISHNPAEATKVEDIKEGIDALEAALYALARNTRRLQ